MQENFSIFQNDQFGEIWVVAYYAQMVEDFKAMLSKNFSYGTIGTMGGL